MPAGEPAGAANLLAAQAPDRPRVPGREQPLPQGDRPAEGLLGLAGVARWVGGWVGGCCLVWLGLFALRLLRHESTALPHAQRQTSSVSAATTSA